MDEILRRLKELREELRDVYVTKQPLELREMRELSDIIDLCEQKKIATGFIPPDCLKHLFDADGKAL